MKIAKFLLKENVNLRVKLSRLTILLTIIYYFLHCDVMNLTYIMYLTSNIPGYTSCSINLSKSYYYLTQLLLQDIQGIYLTGINRI